MLQRGLFRGFKWSLCQLVQHQGEVPRGDARPTFGSVSVETFQETSEILIFADVNGRIPNLSAMADLWYLAVTSYPQTGTEQARIGSWLITLQGMP